VHSEILPTLHRHTSSRISFLNRVGTYIAILVVTLSTVHLVFAHDFEITEVTILLKSQGSYQIDIRTDVDALALGVSPTADSAQVVAKLRAMSTDDLRETIEQVKQTLNRRVRLRFDGIKQTSAITFPEYESRLAVENTIPTIFGLTARFSGMVPVRSKEMTFGASRAFKVVHLTILNELAGKAVRSPLGVGEDSAPYNLKDNGSSVGQLVVAYRYLLLGFEHILPEGLDHILFVLGLFLLSNSFHVLIWQVTAFTLAHSITLALSSYNLVSLSSGPVESLIALSITYVAVENVLTTELKPWRPAVVFCFGLLHGLGFAQVLSQLGLPREYSLTALMTFNIGVELGQISVLMLAFLAVGWFRDKNWYRWAVVLPSSVMICLMGLYLAIERTFL